MTDYKWEFPSNNSGTIDGLNNASLRSFRSSSELSLAIRECIQNSIDARSDFNAPVKIKISLPSIHFKNFPDVNGFQDILRRCKDFKYAQEKHHQKFFNEALDLISGKYSHCDFLRISDFNTTGLDPGSFEDVFIKGKGVSVKKDSGSLGVHGIGKDSIFNLSKIRTAFYSTIDKNNLRSFIGKSVIQSHQREDGEISQGTGYFSLQPGNKPIAEQVDQLHFLDDREEPGLDVFIAGFIKEKSTLDNILVAVVENFYPSIFQKILEVDVMGTEINSKNLVEFVNKYSEEKYKKYYMVVKNRTSFPINKFYQVLISNKEIDGENLVENNLEIYSKNDVTIKTLKNDGNKRVHHYRTSGMIVKSIYMNMPFKLTTLVSINAEPLNSFLKTLENVSHDDLIPYQLDDVDEREEAKRVLALIQQGINENIEEFANSISEEEIDMSGAARFLPDDIDDEQHKTESTSNENDNSEEEEKSLTDEHENLVQKKHKKKIAKKNTDSIKNAYEPDDDGDDSEYVPGGGGTSRKKIKKLKMKEDGEIEKHDFQKYVLNKVRILDADGNGKYAFALESNENKNCYFSVSAISEDYQDNILEVAGCESSHETYEINDKKTIVGPVELKKNQTLYIHLFLKDASRMALRINPFVDNNESK